MPKLTDPETSAFLAEPGHLARIATVDAEGAPLVVPVWFLQRDGQILITPRERSEWLGHLRRDPRVCISIDEEALPYRKVILRGAMRILHDVGEDDVWRETYRAIAERYIPADAADFYIRETIDQPRALAGLEIAKAEVTTWRMPVGDEPYSGIWARRYYREGSRLVTSEPAAPVRPTATK
jgi:nitroimidazol reductase NimA-like FMN-containing flavoprotein (pyridoxamine 5'-phosphate oxidase superfamily)